jgi:ADP-heptose:LPS heptosyltransferase
MNLFFHYGALGDFVLTLPMLRRLSGPITVISDWHRAVLASRLLDSASPMDIELWEFMRLHTQGGPTSVSPAVGELFEKSQHILSFISTGEDDWAQNVARLAPQAKHICIDPRPAEGFDGHITDWHAQQARDRGLALGAPVQPDANGDKTGPIAIHPGSGGEGKCWAVDRYEALIKNLTDRGQRVMPLLGEAEAERWPGEVMERWRTEFGARVIGSLDELHTALSSASAYIGNDSGPTHLAAQLGLPTVALFGPTDSGLWAPVGPTVTVLAPPALSAMDWLDVDAVLDACP